jgi:hypothetical protein
MAELWQSLTDDQIALLGCAAALSVAGAIMSLSYYIGRGRIASLGHKANKPLTIDAQGARLQPATDLKVATNRRDAA